jgi:hypothetical protein
MVLISSFSSINLSHPRSETVSHKFEQSASSSYAPQSGREKEFSKKSYAKNQHSKRVERIKQVQRHLKEKDLPKPKWKPHGGFEFQFGIERVLEMYDAPHEVANLLENFAALYFALRPCTTVKQATAVLFLYFKTHYNESVLERIHAYLSAECDISADLSCQSGLEADSIDATGEPDVVGTWVQVLKDCFTNWKKAVGCNAFSKVSKLISLCSALGLCKLSNFNLDFAGMRVFSIPAMKYHVSASDLVTALLDTAIYFIEGGYECLKRGNFDYFFFSDLAARDFDNEYFDVVEMSGHVRSGNLDRFCDLSENDFDHKLTSLLSKAESLYAAATGSWEKKIFFDRVSKLRSIRADFVSYRTEGKLREAPFTVYVHGGSGIGKSYLSQILMRTILMKNGFDASDDRTIVLNDSDKYMSTYRSFINGIFLDDVGNTRPDFVEKAPSQKIIELCNNVPAYANMAEVDMKGKVTIEPKCIVMTSNLRLGAIANHYSMDVLSIARRAHVHLEVKVKPEYCLPGTPMLDSSKVRQTFGDEQFPDVWDIKVYKPLEVSGGGALQYRDIYESASIMDTLRYVLDESVAHFENQRFIVKNSMNLDKKICLCDVCKSPVQICNCKQKGFEDGCNEAIVKLKAIYGSFWHRVLLYIPDCIYENKYTYAFSSYLGRQWIWQDSSLIRNLIKYFGLLSTMSFCFYGQFLASIFLAICSLFSYGCSLFHSQKKLIRIISDSRHATPKLFKHVRENKAAYLGATCAVLAATYLFVRLMKYSRNLFSQSLLSPNDMAEASEREATPNQWAKVDTTPLPVGDDGRTATSEQLIQMVSANLAYMRLPKHPDGVSFVDALFIRSNVALIPQHVMYDQIMPVEFLFNKSGTIGCKRTGLLNKASSVPIPDTDLCLVHVPFTQPSKDLSRYLPTGVVNSCPGVMVYKNRELDVLIQKARLSLARNVRVGDIIYDGYKYHLPSATFKGLCMATWVTETRIPFIAGFHLAGNGNEGLAGFVTQDVFKSCVDKLFAKPGIVKTCNEGTMQTTLYEKQFYIGPDVHVKSPVNYLTEDATCRYFGQVEGRASYYSKVVTLPISAAVAAVTGVEKLWGKPKFHAWKPWQACLAKTSIPSSGLPAHDLQWAVLDYVNPLLDLVKKEWHVKLKPLTNMETVCGKDGVRFIDKMPPNTSVGYPLGGPKSDYLTKLDPNDYPNQSFPVELDQKFWNEASRMESEYLAGRRCYPIFKACLKDEPTKLTKDKVRVFQGAPIAFQLLIRKYFLPICSFLSLNPILSECAVGINAQGKEWDELARYMMKFGKKRILAGDYAAYDTRMAAQINLSSFDILIQLARASGNYSDEQLEIMHGIATDVCYPVTAFNGDLLELLGSSPSGHNLTVYINSIGNSQMLRCAYHSIVKNIKPFRSVCAMITYGDDCKGSVKEGYDEYNHISVAEYLKQYDVHFTMPDKESVPIPYMSDEDCDFLKRKNIFNSELQIYLGALDENSIFKSLHCVLESKAVTTLEQSASNIDGALREWFAYGRQHYEMRRQQMKQVASDVGITHMCQMLDVNYDLCLTKFRQKYLGEIPPEEEPQDLEHQSGVELGTNSLYYRTIERLNLTNAKIDYKVLDCIAEIDIYSHLYPDLVLIVEIKEHCPHASSCTRHLARTKGRHQLERICGGLSIMNPNFTYIGVLVTEEGFEWHIMPELNDTHCEFLSAKWGVLPLMW